MYQVYERCGYKVYTTSKKEYVVHNSNVTNEFLHSHVRNIKSAKLIIELSMKEKIRGDIPVYLMESVIRLSNNEEFKENYKRVKQQKLDRRKDYYFNPSKGIKLHK